MVYGGQTRQCLLVKSTAFAVDAYGAAIRSCTRLLRMDSTCVHNLHIVSVVLPSRSSPIRAPSTVV